MDNENKIFLNEEIARQLAELRNLNVGSEEMSGAVKDLDLLCRVAIEDEKTTSDTFKSMNDISEAKKDRWVKIGIAGAEIILPLAFYAFWLVKGFKFEETGCITSTVFKGLINRFRPTK